MNGNDHDGEDHAGGQHAEAGGRALEQPSDQPDAAEDAGQQRLDVIGEEGREHEQSPHAVDDRRNRREQLDRGAERTLQRRRAHFGEEDRDAETDRNADQQRDGGRDERAVDRRERAELAGDGIPDVGDEKCRAELSQRGERRIRERDDDAHEQCEHQRRKRARRMLEQRILPPSGRRPACLQSRLDDGQGGKG